MDDKSLKFQLTKYIGERKSLHENDSFAIYKKWEELIELLSEHENETINLIQNSTKDEIDWISEVMEEVSANLNSNDYIAALKKISIKYPDCNLDYTIEISIKHMSKNHET